MPTREDAIHIVRHILATGVSTISRFPTGLCHYVYDIVTDDGRHIVVRMADDTTRDALAGGIYWHERLRAVGVPLPALLYSNLGQDGDIPVMVLERLPGRDLGDEYDQLAPVHRRAIAHQIAAIQGRVATLPPARGYGFARSYDDPTLHASWLDVVLAELERSRQRIAAVGAVDISHVDRVCERVQAIAPYLRDVQPHAFLDDTTTKNVLVHEGMLSGIVDTDYVCFGDPLFTVALTHMALLAHRHDTDYITYWCERLHLSEPQRQALAIYTAVFCVNFLGEIGQQFNQDEAPPVDVAYQRHLEAILQQLLEA
ncbi:MAG: phosphotransferase family protein [Ktedonobacterales bacterium]